MHGYISWYHHKPSVWNKSHNAPTESCTVTLTEYGSYSFLWRVNDEIYQPRAHLHCWSNSLIVKSQANAVVAGWGNWRPVEENCVIWQHQLKWTRKERRRWAAVRWHSTSSAPAVPLKLIVSSHSHTWNLCSLRCQSKERDLVCHCSLPLASGCVEQIKCKMIGRVIRHPGVCAHGTYNKYTGDPGPMTFDISLFAIQTKESCLQSKSKSIQNLKVTPLMTFHVWGLWSHFALTSVDKMLSLLIVSLKEVITAVSDCACQLIS